MPGSPAHCSAQAASVPPQAVGEAGQWEQAGSAPAGRTGRGLRHRPYRARQSCCRAGSGSTGRSSSHAALTAGMGCPGPCSKRTRSHLHQSTLIQEELSLPLLKNIHPDQPRKRSWGLSGAGAGCVPRVSPPGSKHAARPLLASAAAASGCNAVRSQAARTAAL